jgi:hypothetical protein
MSGIMFMVLMNDSCVIWIKRWFVGWLFNHGPHCGLKTLSLCFCVDGPQTKKSTDSESGQIERKVESIQGSCRLVTSRHGQGDTDATDKGLYFVDSATVKRCNSRRIGSLAYVTLHLCLSHDTSSVFLLESIRIPFWTEEPKSTRKPRQGGPSVSA